MRFASFFNPTCQQRLICPEPLFPHREAPTTSFHPIQHLHSWETPPFNPTFNYNTHLQAFLSNKRLPLDDLPFSIETIQAHYMHGYVTYDAPFVVDSKNRKRCRRCGNTESRHFTSFYNVRVHEKTVYCRQCVKRGRVDESTPFVRWIGPVRDEKCQDVSCNWQGTLSPSQQRASDKLVNYLEKRGEVVIHAVCGAGKTEMLFRAIERALHEEKKIAMTSPRVDVIRELAPRLQQAFPKVTMRVLYGGSEEKRDDACLTLATTYQLLPFYHAFDVLILDEVDAFPYTTDRTLQYAVSQAVKKEGLTVYVTATPEEKMLERIERGKLPSIEVPARYHGYPLPLPTFQWVGRWEKALANRSVPEPLLRWIDAKLKRERQAFLFVPSVGVLDMCYEALSVVDKERIATIHAHDPARYEKLDQFRKGTIQLLITTTILERGVTVPYSDVAVLGAEDHVFSWRALVQIAGRVGRRADDPVGDVRFFHYGKSRAMVQARRHIVQMNRKARKGGGLI